MKKDASLLAALPTYDGRRYNSRAMAELLLIPNLSVRVMEIQSSLLALNCNRVWAEALHARPTFFLMMHDDIIPVEETWISTLFEEMYLHKASILSVVSPIKNTDGLTSTALETDDPWNPRRLSMKEIYDRPETWTDPNLLVNTGLMLVDFRQDWVEKIHFTIKDRLIFQNDHWVAETQPEDWNFTRLAREAGASIYVTRKVLVQHVGRAGYDNGMVWGTETTDPKYKPAEVLA